ncbi:MAG: molybdenum cofactor guanylyltransferase [Pyrinomonadaceae bacterium]
MAVDLEAFILIGGRSTRFGTDKAFFEYEGETLALRTVATVEAAFPDFETRFVAASEEQFRIQEDSLARAVVFDLRKGFGAWSGLDAALSHSEAEWTLVLACDLPFITIHFLRSLVEMCGPDIEAVVSRDATGREQPLCSVYRTAAVRQAVERHMATVDNLPPLRELIAELRTTFVDAASDELRNVNSPADLV